MDNKDIPYIAFEGAMARMERVIKRLALLAALSLFFLFASNAAWLWAWTRYDYGVEEVSTQEVTQDGDGTNVFGDGNEVSNESDGENDGP